MIKEIDKCPKDEKIEPKSDKCLKCKHHITAKKWFSRNRPVDIFCGFFLNDQEKRYLK